MARPRVLLTGASGYLGRHIRAKADLAGVDVVAPARTATGAPLDLDNPASIRAAVASARPDVVLHAGALSSIAACERDPGAAARVNAHATATLCACGPRMVYVSTDLVFGGDRAPYAPSDTPRPLSVYGRSKAHGEDAVLATASGLVARLPLLFGPSFDGRRGATDMIRAAAQENRTVSLFTDEFRTPLHVADAALLLVDLALDATRRGVVHVAGRERVSRWELGQRFVARARLAGALLRPAPLDDPRRPRDVSLRSDVWPARDLDAALADS